MLFVKAKYKKIVRWKDRSKTNCELTKYDPGW